MKDVENAKIATLDEMLRYLLAGTTFFAAVVTAFEVPGEIYCYLRTGGAIPSSLLALSVIVVGTVIYSLQRAVPIFLIGTLFLDLTGKKVSDSVASLSDEGASKNRTDIIPWFSMVPGPEFPYFSKVNLTQPRKDLKPSTNRKWFCLRCFLVVLVLCGPGLWNYWSAPASPLFFRPLCGGTFVMGVMSIVSDLTVTLFPARSETFFTMFPLTIVGFAVALVVITVAALCSYRWAYANVAGVDLVRWKNLANTKHIQHRLREWATQIHFMYGVGWSGLFALDFGRVIGWPQGRYYYQVNWASTVMLIFALLYHVRYLRWEAIVLEESLSDCDTEAKSKPTEMNSVNDANEYARNFKVKPHGNL